MEERCKMPDTNIYIIYQHGESACLWWIQRCYFILPRTGGRNSMSATVSVKECYYNRPEGYKTTFQFSDHIL